MNIKKGDYVKIISVPEEKEHLQVGSVYKIAETQECYLLNTVGCKNNCKSSFMDIDICLPARRGDVKALKATICSCEIELYKGIEENTVCYNCEDKIFCIIKT